MNLAILLILIVFLLNVKKTGKNPISKTQKNILRIEPDNKQQNIREFHISVAELERKPGDLLLRLNAILAERYLSDPDRTTSNSHFIKDSSDSQSIGRPRVYIDSKTFIWDINSIDPASIKSIIIIRYETPNSSYHPLDEDDTIIITLKKTFLPEQKQFSFGWIELLLITIFFISFFGGKIIFKNSEGVKFGMEITGGLEHVRKFNRERNNDRFKRILQEKHMEGFQVKKTDDVVKLLKELDNPHDTKE